MHTLSKALASPADVDLVHPSILGFGPGNGGAVLERPRSLDPLVAMDAPVSLDVEELLPSAVTKTKEPHLLVSKLGSSAAHSSACRGQELLEEPSKP